MAAPDAPGSLRLGVRFEPDWPPEDLPAFARQAQEQGYDELWFSEDLPWAGGIAMAATALAHTTSLRVGLGLLPAVTRNVVTLAMEVAALERLAPGRLVLGVGHGVPEWMAQIGAATPRPAAALEETTLVLRRLLAGERVTFHGTHVRVDDVALGRPPAACPEILVGTTGPVGLAMAARCSDGVVLPEVTVPDAVRWARAQMAGAGDPGSTVVFAMVEVDDDRDRALQTVRQRVRRVLDLGIFPQLTRLAGLGAEADGEVTDDVVTSIAAAGGPDDVVRALTGWSDAGASRVVLVAGGDDAPRSYARVAAQVLPRLRAAGVVGAGPAPAPAVSPSPPRA
ncbi:LLM class flavin-dependent oxidoreductase [uncultured Cellulomonas sp.]|uniref:LLM class flavin-dependent oxidoreductase n=1 Tax=uncultured Cellulomonas sp. TaxID=189682 RepID=UPI0026339467|nr:LLM class flavin-dependent oxidoreductase [uncultured Cellulomonas sp.]